MRFTIANPLSVRRLTDRHWGIYARQHARDVGR